MGNRIENHSDLAIYKNAIGLIQRVLFGEFGIFEQIKDCGVDLEELIDRADGDICYELSNFTIIQSLLLSETNHSGGTSTIEKCREISIDPYEDVRFSVKEYLKEE